MSTEVDICNLALGNIHAKSINDLGETDNVEAPACKLRYPIARDLVLAEAWWQFAGRDEAGALLSEEPTEWSYAYAYPQDCLEVRYIVPPGKARYRFDEIEFKVGILSDGTTKAILTNQEDACIAYTFRQTDTQKFPAHFVTALSWYLSGDLAIPVAGTERGRDLRKESLQIYQISLGAAISHDADMQYSDERDPETIEARQ